MTITATIDSASDGLLTAYGAVAGKRVAARVADCSLTDKMDARIAAEGYRRVGEWVKRGPLDYTAPIEAHPQRCETCVNGCDCEAGTPGCGHAYCWGVVPDEVFNSCPGALLVRV